MNLREKQGNIALSLSIISRDVITGVSIAMCPEL